MKRIIIFGAVIALMILFAGFPYFRAFSVSKLQKSECSPDLINAAQARITSVYGTPASRPIRMCMNSPAMGLDVQYGVTHFLPFVPSINVIGPKGMNVDVVAHEWVHGETEQVLGFVTRNYKIPVWLDEGIAMQADYRTAYSREALMALIESHDTKTPLLEDMAKAKDFFTQGKQGRLHYALAKCVVAEAVKAEHSTPPSELIKSLAKMHESEPKVFGAAFGECTR